MRPPKLNKLGERVEKMALHDARNVSKVCAWRVAGAVNLGTKDYEIS